MNKKIILITLILSLCILVSADKLFDNYSIVQQKLRLSGQLSELERKLLENERISLEEKILSNPASYILDTVSKKSLSEQYFLRPLLKLEQEKICTLNNKDNNTLKKIDDMLNEIPEDVQVIPDDAYFIATDGRKIIFEKDFWENVEDVQYPIIDNNLSIEAIANTELTEFPVIITFNITHEVITKNIFLDYAEDSGEQKIFRKTIKVTDLYSRWPGMDENPNNDKLIEFTTISGLEEPYFNYYKVGDPTYSMDEAILFFKKNTKMISRDNSVVLGNYDKGYPDGNKKNISCGGTITLDLAIGLRNTHKTSVRDTADWIFYEGHGSHYNSGITVEYHEDNNPDKAVYIYAPPYTDLMGWESETDLFMLFSCSVLDINDYNWNYPLEHEASPGKNWARLKNIDLLGFNNYAYANDGINTIKSFLNNKDVMTFPVVCWLATSNINPDIAAIDKQDNYYYWHKVNVAGLPYYKNELRIIPKNEWSNPVRETNTSFDIKINKELLATITGINREDITKRLESLNKFYSNMKKQNTLKTKDAFDVMKKTVSNSNEELLLDSMMKLMSRYSYENGNLREYSKNRKEAIKVLEKISSEDNSLKVPAMMLTAQSYLEYNQNKAISIYSKLAKDNLIPHEISQLGIITANINSGNIIKASDQITNLKTKDITEKTYQALKELEEFIYDIKNTQNNVIEKVYEKMEGGAR